ncbi:MAG: hypothetical protein ACOCZ7_04480, partial [Armatimonadota bacterium]
MTRTMTPRRSFVILTALVLVAVALPAVVHAASMEIWPSERRANNTFFCYGDDWTWMLLSIYPEDWGKHRLELPEEFVEPTVLTVTLPESVQFLGAEIMRGGAVETGFESERVEDEGRRYQRIEIPLPNETLQ